jgi:hypothetical protein
MIISVKKARNPARGISKTSRETLIVRMPKESDIDPAPT